MILIIRRTLIKTKNIPIKKKLMRATLTLPWLLDADDAALPCCQWVWREAGWWPPSLLPTRGEEGLDGSKEPRREEGGP